MISVELGKRRGLERLPEVTGALPSLYLLGAARQHLVAMRGKPSGIAGTARRARFEELIGVHRPTLEAVARKLRRRRTEVPIAGLELTRSPLVILAGADPAVALRDERTRWLAADPRSWTRAVLPFD